MDEWMTMDGWWMWDNQAALKLANLELPYMTSRSKHIVIKYHWFRGHSDVDWSVMPISTKEQIADIFYKRFANCSFWISLFPPGGMVMMIYKFNCIWSSRGSMKWEWSRVHITCPWSLYRMTTNDKDQNKSSETLRFIWDVRRMDINCH